MDRIAKGTAADERQDDAATPKRQGRQKRSQVRRSQKLPADRYEGPPEGRLAAIAAAGDRGGEHLSDARFTLDGTIPVIAQSHLSLVVNANADRVKVRFQGRGQGSWVPPP